MVLGNRAYFPDSRDLVIIMYNWVIALLRIEANPISRTTSSEYYRT